ncbi:Phage protein [Bacillus cereus]|nr:Phage protein [Bacillus cereus]
MLQLYWFIIPIIFVERVVKGMSKLDQFIERAKAYVVTDVEEKALREKYKEVIMSTMQKIRDGLKQVEGYDYHVDAEETYSNLTLHDKKIVIMIDSVKNHITVYENSDIIDEIILKEGHLFSTKHEQIFTEDILVDYLNETFKGIIG